MMSFSITVYACSETHSGQKVDVESTDMEILSYQLGKCFVFSVFE